MDNVVEKLHSLLFSTLINNCPVMSGNMRSSIRQGTPGEIVIEAPYYDIPHWRRTREIVHVLTKIVSKRYTTVREVQLHYANDVNEYGAFHSGNDSRHWVNRAIIEAVQPIASELGAEIVNELPLY